jgi:hypothetical protein
MSWYCIELSPEQVEFGFADIVRAELEEIFISRGAQEYFTVWKQQDESGTRLYLSPVAAESAQLLVFRFGGTRCDEPEKTSLDFLLGYAFRDDI